MTGEDADFSPSSVAKYLHNLPGAITSPVGVVTDAWQSPSGWLYISAVVPASSATDPLAWMIQAGKTSRFIQFRTGIDTGLQGYSAGYR